MQFIRIGVRENTEHAFHIPHRGMGHTCSSNRPRPNFMFSLLEGQGERGEAGEPGKPIPPECIPEGLSKCIITEYGSPAEGFELNVPGLLRKFESQ